LRRRYTGFQDQPNRPLWHPTISLRLTASTSQSNACGHRDNRPPPSSLSPVRLRLHRSRSGQCTDSHGRPAVRVGPRSATSIG
jgi:hypothetical protein